MSIFQKAKKYHKSNKGFTLIELLAVVGIIAVLYIVLAPRLGGGEDAARMAGVQSDFRNINMGLTNYMSVKPPAIRTFNDSYPDYKYDTHENSTDRFSGSVLRVTDADSDDFVGFGHFDRQTIETYIDRALLADADLSIGQGDPWGRRYKFTDISPFKLKDENGNIVEAKPINLGDEGDGWEEVTTHDLAGRYLLVWSSGPDNIDTVPIVLYDLPKSKPDVTSMQLETEDIDRLQPSDTGAFGSNTPFIEPKTFRPQLATIQDPDAARKQLWMVIYIGRNQQLGMIPELSQVRFEEKVAEARSQGTTHDENRIIGPVESKKPDTEGS
jgi:prepilin-type N-terminal cleavage/methylation domain-containing protein